VRSFSSRQRPEVRITELSRWRFENINLVLRLEFDPLQRETFLVIQSEDVFLTVDRRPAFDVEGMDGDKTHPMPAFDPANWLQVVSLYTDTPDITMPPLNPASCVTHGPAPWDHVASQSRTDNPLFSGDRIPLHLVTNGCRKTRREGIWINRIKRRKRIDELRRSKRGGADEVHLHYMCGLPP
jgi:hypothetical protein